MWYSDYKKQSYKINWQAPDAYGLKAAWLIDSPTYKFYDKCGDIILESPHPYVPYCGHFSPEDSLYGVSAPVAQSSIFYGVPNTGRILETTSGNFGVYNRDITLHSPFTNSFSVFTRVYYHPGTFNFTKGTGIFACFSNAIENIPNVLCVDSGGFKFSVDGGNNCATLDFRNLTDSGTINLPEGWYDIWGIFDSGANPNTRLVVNGEEQRGIYTRAPQTPSSAHSFVVGGDKGTGNNFTGTYSEIRYYNWAVPLGLAQYVYEPSNIKSLYSIPDDLLFVYSVAASANLYTFAGTEYDNDIDLFLKTPEPSNKGMSLRTSGPIPLSGNINLLICNDLYSTNQTTLYTYSSTADSGVMNAFNLFLESDGNKAGINLYIPNTELMNPIPTSTINLFLESYYDKASAFTRMFVKGSAFEGSSTTRTGYVPKLENMSLYLFNNTPEPTITPESGLIGLFLASDYSNNLTMYMGGIIDIVNSGVSIFMSGISEMNNSSTLYTHGF